MRATITSKGQVTIPMAVRTDLKIGAGDRIEFVKLPDGNYEILAATQDIRVLKGLVKTSAKVSISDMNRAVRDRAGDL